MLEALDRKTLLLGVLAVLIVMNLVSFALMGIDKRRAQRGAWRISEKALLLTTACFGGLGGVMGMRLFHHKTKHWYFRVFLDQCKILGESIEGCYSSAIRYV